MKLIHNRGRHKDSYRLNEKVATTTKTLLAKAKECSQLESKDDLKIEETQKKDRKDQEGLLRIPRSQSVSRLMNFFLRKLMKMA